MTDKNSKKKRGIDTKKFNPKGIGFISFLFISLIILCNFNLRTVSAADPGECVSCHSIEQGNTPPVIQTINHHSGECLTCHDEAAPDGRIPHDGVQPLKTDESCKSCHSESITSMNHPVQSGTPSRCIKCHAEPGVAPVVAKTCGQCHAPEAGTAQNRFTTGTLLVLAQNMHKLIPRTASFTWSASSISKQIEFVATGCISGTCTYDWMFGDGQTAKVSTAATSHLYANAGPYIAFVKITEGSSEIESPIKNVAVKAVNPPPTPVRTLAVFGWAVTVTDSSTDDAQFPENAVFVDWGNGTTSRGNANSTISKIYNVAGTYVIKHGVTDAGGLTIWSSPNILVAVPMKQKFKR